MKGRIRSEVGGGGLYTFWAGVEGYQNVFTNSVLLIIRLMFSY